MRLPLIFLLFIAFAAPPGRAAETYDLIFRTGTLADVPTDRALEYERTVVIAADPERAARNTGAVRLAFEDEETARLEFTQGEKGRVVGAFPATVGNPIILYFVETVLRDVAQQAGGSPFYVRNRIKDALVKPAEIEDVKARLGDDEVSARRVTLRPFEADKNRDKMRGYGDLALTFTMSEAAPGWYLSLVAEAKSPSGGGPIYANELILRPAEARE